MLTFASFGCGSKASSVDKVDAEEGGLACIKNPEGMEAQLFEDNSSVRPANCLRIC